MTVHVFNTNMKQRENWEWGVALKPQSLPSVMDSPHQKGGQYRDLRLMRNIL